jgi:hypothetical protein
MYLDNLRKLFPYYRSLGEKAMQQVSEEQLFYQPNETSNSIAIIVQHIAGNMLSRFTNFLTEDGEKSWRNRDSEFEIVISNKEDLLKRWKEGWACLENALDNLQESDLEKIVYIRNEGHSVMEALNRQLAHYAYHIGQMIFVAKMLSDENWKSLSIPKNRSQQFNQEKFSQEKSDKFFTDRS